MLAWRRVQIWRGRPRGPELGLLAEFDHAALAREMAATIPPPPARGPVATQPAPSTAPGLAPIGELPEPWASCGFQEAGGPMSGARALAVAGDLSGATAAAAAEGPPEVA